MQNIAIIVLLLCCFSVLFALFVLSYKMLNKVRKEERLERSHQLPERQLHPKLKNQKDDKNN